MEHEDADADDVEDSPELVLTVEDVVGGGTWSHAVISSLGARARGVGGQALAFRVARCQTWTILDSGQSPVMSHRDGFRQRYSNFWHRPYPLAQNRGTI